MSGVEKIWKVSRVNINCRRRFWIRRNSERKSVAKKWRKKFPRNLSVDWQQRYLFAVCVWHFLAFSSQMNTRLFLFQEVFMQIPRTTYARGNELPLGEDECSIKFWIMYNLISRQDRSPIRHMYTKVKRHQP